LNVIRKSYVDASSLGNRASENGTDTESAAEMEAVSDDDTTADTDDSSESESGSNTEDVGTRHKSKSCKGKTENETDHRTRAPRNSKGRKQVKFTQLQAYPGQWRSVLEDAKQRNRSSTATAAGFPKRRAGLKNAEDCLAEAMAAHEAEDGVVEEGMQAIHTSIMG
jgi:hypothetical protein